MILLDDGCHCTMDVFVLLRDLFPVFARDHDSPDATFIFILIIARFLQKQRIGIRQSRQSGVLISQEEKHDLALPTTRQAITTIFQQQEAAVA